MFDPVPAGVDLSIEIAPAGAGIENALDPIAVTLDESESYIAVASGVLASSGFTNTADFSLELFTGGKANSANENGVELNVHHGAPDAPNVDIYLEQTGSVDPAVSNLAYSDFTGYVPFASNDETIGIAEQAEIFCWNSRHPSAHLQVKPLQFLPRAFLIPKM